MEAFAGLASYGSSDDDSDARSAAHETSPPPSKRTRRAEQGETTRPQGREDREAWRRALLIESLWKLQQDCGRWPSPGLAAQRKEAWAWFESVCAQEFAPELGAHAHVGNARTGLHMFGSEVCNMWVAGRYMLSLTHTYTHTHTSHTHTRTPTHAHIDTDTDTHHVHVSFIHTHIRKCR